MTKKLKKIVLALLVCVSAMAGTLAWLTTSDTKKGKVNAADFDVLVESVDVKVTESEDNPTSYEVLNVTEADESGFFYKQDNVYPISSTNTAAIKEKIPFQYIRITNNSDMDALIQIGVSNINMANKETNALVFDEEETNYTPEQKAKLLSGASYMFWFDKNSVNKEQNGYELPTYGTRVGQESTTDLKEIFVDHTDEKNVDIEKNIFSAVYDKTGDTINPYPFVLKAHTSVVIPFKVFLNENAGNEYLDLSLVYEVSVKARNINIGDDESEFLIGPVTNVQTTNTNGDATDNTNEGENTNQSTSGDENNIVKGTAEPNSGS